jgi:hypothetical protein
MCLVVSESLSHKRLAFSMQAPETRPVISTRIVEDGGRGQQDGAGDLGGGGGQVGEQKRGEQHREVACSERPRTLPPATAVRGPTSREAVVPTSQAKEAWGGGGGWWGRQRENQQYSDRGDGFTIAYPTRKSKPLRLLPGPEPVVFGG